MTRVKHIYEGVEPQQRRRTVKGDCSHRAGAVAAYGEPLDRLDYRVCPIGRRGNTPPPSRKISSDEEPGAKETRRRVAVACARCRKRKIRCSGDPGDGSGCHNCRTAGADVRECRFTRVGANELDLVPTGVQMRPNCSYHPSMASPVSVYRPHSHYVLDQGRAAYETASAGFKSDNQGLARFYAPRNGECSYTHGTETRGGQVMVDTAPAQTTTIGYPRPPRISGSGHYQHQASMTGETYSPFDVSSLSTSLSGPNERQLPPTSNNCNHIDPECSSMTLDHQRGFITGYPSPDLQVRCVDDRRHWYHQPNISRSLPLISGGSTRLGRIKGASSWQEQAPMSYMQVVDEAHRPASPTPAMSPSSKTAALKFPVEAYSGVSFTTALDRPTLTACVRRSDSSSNLYTPESTCSSHGDNVSILVEDDTPLRGDQPRSSIPPSRPAHMSSLDDLRRESIRVYSPRSLSTGDQGALSSSF